MMITVVALVFCLVIVLWLVALVYGPFAAARPWLAWVAALVLGLAVFAGAGRI